MKIIFEEDGNDIIFRLTEFDQKYIKILDACFYKKENDCYIKRFPKGINNIDKIKENYLKYAKTMFDQCGYFIEIPWQKGLQEFCSIINKTKIEWWLTGSCATCIRGIGLNPHDIDIMVKSEYINEMNNIFSDHIIEPIVDTNGWVTRYFGVMFLHVRIDLAFDPSPELDKPQPCDYGLYAQQNLDEEIWNGYKIRIPPLDLQLHTNKLRGRTDRVDKIEKYLADR